MNRPSVRSLICFAASVSTSFLSLASETLVLRFRARRFLRLQALHFVPQSMEFGLKGVELIAANKIQFGGKLVGLSAEGRFGFLARRLGDAQGRVRKFGKLVQEWILSLHECLIMGKRGGCEAALLSRCVRFTHAC